MSEHSYHGATSRSFGERSQNWQHERTLFNDAHPFINSYIVLNIFVLPSGLTDSRKKINAWEGRKYFYLMTHSTHFILCLHGVGYVVKDHSDSERGNLLPPHGLLFPISNKGSFIHTIPGWHIPLALLHQSWSTGWNEK